jgi:hypothetical protein
MTCRQDIKLERKSDNSGWNKFNLDGSPHVHTPKKQKNNNNTNDDVSSRLASIETKLDKLDLIAKMLEALVMKQPQQKQETAKN